MSLKILDIRSVLKAAVEKYDPSKGWDTTAQPEKMANLGLIPSEYCEIAQQAIPTLQSKAYDFLQNNHLSFLQVSQQEFCRDYEHGVQPFSEWLESVKSKRNVTGNVDVLMIGPCVKGLERAEGKVAFQPPEQAAWTKDYLRTEFIFLKGGSPGQTKKTIDKMGDTIFAMECDQETLARKNQFYEPHKKTGYRGHHAIWACDVPRGQSLEDLSILAEIKIEHELQQDVNRLTRKIQEHHRTAESYQSEFYVRCGTEHHHNYQRMADRILALEGLGRAAYDYMHKMAGFNRFLNPEKITEHEIAAEDLNEHIKSAAGSSLQISNMIAQSGIHIPKIVIPTYRPANP